MGENEPRDSRTVTQNPRGGRPYAGPPQGEALRAARRCEWKIDEEALDPSEDGGEG